MPISQRLLFCLFVIGFLLVGCGPKLPPGAKPTKPVTVTVTYKGAPVEGAVVTFADQGDKPANANGITDAQGKAKLKTYIDGDGAVVGSHKVAIAKMEAVGGQNVEVDDPKYDPNAPPSTVKSHLPQKYSSPATSGLTAEVTAAGPNEFPFELKD
jgi:hypothetical protein